MACPVRRCKQRTKPPFPFCSTCWGLIPWRERARTSAIYFGFLRSWHGKHTARVTFTWARRMAEMLTYVEDLRYRHDLETYHRHNSDGRWRKPKIGHRR